MRFGVVSPFAQAGNPAREFCEQCGYTRGKDGEGMSVFQIAADGWSCASAPRWQRAWHSRWLGGTGRAPHRWEARDAAGEPLGAGRMVYRLQLACVACGLQDEVTQTSAAAVLASGIALTPMARQSLGLVAPIEFKVNSPSGNLVMRVDAASDAGSPRASWRRTKALGRAAFWLLELPWRVALWPVRQALRLTTAPARAVRAWWRWSTETEPGRLLVQVMLFGGVVAFAAAIWHGTVADVRRCAQREFASQVVDLVEGNPMRLTFADGSAYECKRAPGERRIVTRGTTGYICENGHFHPEGQAPVAPPAPNIPLGGGGEDF